MRIPERDGHPPSKEDPGIRVEFYSGYKNEETPRALVRGGRRLRVIEVLERKRLFNVSTRISRDSFLLRMENGEVLRVEGAGAGRWSGKAWTRP